MSKTIGKVAQIIGPVIDVVFDAQGVELPKIYDSLEVTKADGSKLVLEVQSHIGENMVRTISMDSTDGLSRGQEAVATGAPIQMPIGAAQTDFLSTDKLLNLRIFLLLPKFFSPELKLSTLSSLMQKEEKSDFSEVRE
jgi:hypothetical protein